MLHSPLREAILHRTGSFGPGILIEGQDERARRQPRLVQQLRDRRRNGASSPASRSSTRRRSSSRTARRGRKGCRSSRRFRAPARSSRTAARRSAHRGPRRAAAGATVTVGGATAQGGIVAGAGAAFGTIAWIPGSRTAVGTAVDAAVAGPRGLRRDVEVQQPRARRIGLHRARAHERRGQEMRRRRNRRHAV